MQTILAAIGGAVIALIPTLIVLVIRAQMTKRKDLENDVKNHDKRLLDEIKGTIKGMQMELEKKFEVLATAIESLKEKLYTGYVEKKECEKLCERNDRQHSEFYKFADEVIELKAQVESIAERVSALENKKYL
jgi:hypothetical protein